MRKLAKDNLRVYYTQNYKEYLKEKKRIKNKNIIPFVSYLRNGTYSMEPVDVDIPNELITFIGDYNQFIKNHHSIHPYLTYDCTFGYLRCVHPNEKYIHTCEYLPKLKIKAFSLIPTCYFYTKKDEKDEKDDKLCEKNKEIYEYDEEIYEYDREIYEYDEDTSDEDTSEKDQYKYNYVESYIMGNMRYGIDSHIIAQENFNGYLPYKKLRYIDECPNDIKYKYYNLHDNKIYLNEEQSQYLMTYFKKIKFKDFIKNQLLSMKKNNTTTIIDYSRDEYFDPGVGTCIWQNYYVLPIYGFIHMDTISEKLHNEININLQIKKFLNESLGIYNYIIDNKIRLFLKDNDYIYHSDKYDYLNEKCRYKKLNMIT